MSAKKLINNHYIPRSLTKPWEGENRTLTYYDFESQTIKEAPSKNLFAKEGLFEDKHEGFLNKYIEKPIDAFKQQFKDNKLDNGIKDWKVFRALYLRLLFSVSSHTTNY